MYKHHQDSMEKMTAHYRENPEIRALFLIGSVATGTERPDSDLDGAAVVSEAYYEQRKAAGALEEVYHGKCTYEGGYFNVHYMTRRELEEIAAKGSEPMRNMFSGARVLFCAEPGLPELAAGIPVFQTAEAAEKQFRFYCTLKMYHGYFWTACKPEGLVGRCRRFMETLSDEDCLALVSMYEGWTAYDYPKDYDTVMNHFSDPYDWR